MPQIILGDVHLGASTSLGKVSVGTFINSRVNDQVDLLDWTLEQALLTGSETIIITGDVFEEPKPHPSIITLFISWLKKCVNNGIAVEIIIGNHDIYRTGQFYVSPLDIISECDLPGISIHKDISTIFIGNIAFTFVPFRDRKSFNVESHTDAISILSDRLNYELLSIPSTYNKVLIGHLALEGSIPVGDEIDDLTNELFCPLSMFNGYDYVLMGHIHKPQVLSTIPYIAHVGSMDISNFGETDQEKHLIFIDSNEKNKLTEIIIPTRKLNKLVISVPSGTQNTTDFILDEIKKVEKSLINSIVKLDVHLTSPELLPMKRSKIEEALYSNGVFNVSSLSESKKLSPIKKEELIDNIIDNSLDINSAIKRWASSQIDEDKREMFIEVATNIVSKFKNEAKD